MIHRHVPIVRTSFHHSLPYFRVSGDPSVTPAGEPLDPNKDNYAINIRFQTSNINKVVLVCGHPACLDIHFPHSYLLLD